MGRLEWILVGVCATALAATAGVGLGWGGEAPAYQTKCYEFITVKGTTEDKAALLFDACAGTTRWIYFSLSPKVL